MIYGNSLPGERWSCSQSPEEAQQSRWEKDCYLRPSRRARTALWPCQAEIRPKESSAWFAWPWSPIRQSRSFHPCFCQLRPPGLGGERRSKSLATNCTKFSLTQINCISVSWAYCAGVTDSVHLTNRWPLHSQMSIHLDSFLVNLVRSTNIHDLDVGLPLSGKRWICHSQQVGYPLNKRIHRNAGTP